MNQNLRIGELLKLKSMTLSDLARSINQLENKKEGDDGYLTQGNLYTSLNDNPTLRTLKRIANCLNIELFELFKRKNEIYGYISLKTTLKTGDKTFSELKPLKLYLEKILATLNENNSLRGLSIKDNFYDLLKSKNIDINDVLNVIQTTKQNLNHSLMNHPTLDRLELLSNILDIDIRTLLGDCSETEYRGLVSIHGEIFTINSVVDIKNLYDFIVSFERRKIDENQLDRIINEVLVDIDEHDHVSQSFIQNGNSFDLNYLKFNASTILDGTIENCWSFRNNGDIRNGFDVNFGNMVKYPMTLFDKQFNDSESAYIAGCYTNPDRRSVEIMGEISDFKGGGYMLKKNYRSLNKLEDTIIHIRKDWKKFNIDWMLLVLWSKVQTNNEFREMLKQVPIDAHIIEDTSFMHSGDTTQVWGAKNIELKELRSTKNKLLIKRLLREGLTVLATFDKGEQKLHNRINNAGIWKGQNLTGKCLKLCQLALLQETIPPIDFELLNNSNIYWFGQKIRIFADGNKISYEVIEN
jgi:transcriptional regulator with XRE-family HTH domain